MNDPRSNPPLSAADPRLSEWLDGRLPAAEAAEIARLVAASPELTQVVADLRRQQAWLAGLPAATPPAGFVQDVLAALDAAGDEASTAAAVEAEWRRIERERLEEEIAEAREDAAEPAGGPLRHRWPWLALAGALAAGLLVAVVIERPAAPGRRDVALAEPRKESHDATRKLNVKLGEALRGEASAADEAVAEKAAALAGERLEQSHSDHIGNAAPAAAGPPPTPAALDARRLQDMASASTEAEAMAGTLEQAKRIADRGPRELQAGALDPGTPAAREGLLADAEASGHRLGGGSLVLENLKKNQLEQRADRVVTFRIRHADDRRRLQTLLADSGLVVDDGRLKQSAALKVAAAPKPAGDGVGGPRPGANLGLDKGGPNQPAFGYGADGPLAEGQPGSSSAIGSPAAMQGDGQAIAKRGIAPPGAPAEGQQGKADRYLSQAANEAAGRRAGLPGERWEIVGPPAAIADLIAALETPAFAKDGARAAHLRAEPAAKTGSSVAEGGSGEAPLAGRGGGGGSWIGSIPASAAPGVVRLWIEIVDETAPAAPAGENNP